MDNIAETLEQINTALQLLGVGRCYKVGNLYLGMDADYFLVGAYSSTFYFDNQTKQSAIEDLESMKLEFENMITASTRLRQFVAGKTLRYSLDFGHEKSGFPICYEINGAITWQDLRLR